MTCQTRRGADARGAALHSTPLPIASPPRNRTCLRAQRETQKHGDGDGGGGRRQLAVQYSTIQYTESPREPLATSGLLPSSPHNETTRWAQRARGQRSNKRQVAWRGVDLLAPTRRAAALRSRAVRPALVIASHRLTRRVPQTRRGRGDWQLCTATYRVAHS